MSIAAATSIANIDPTLKFTTPQALIDQLNNLITTTIDDTIVPYIIGSATPAVDDQDKVWQRLDSSGRPLGTYVYHAGFWVLPPPAFGSRVGFWFGDPTDPSMWNADGLGLPGAGPVANDNFGWQIANGKHTTANLSDQMLICGRVDNVGITGWDAGTQLWRTNITGAPLTQGGTAEITLDGTNTYRPAQAAVDNVSPFTATGQARESDGSDHSGALYGGIGDGSHDKITLLAADAGQTTPDPISVVNPFYAGAIIAWVGYAEAGY